MKILFICKENIKNAEIRRYLAYLSLIFSNFAPWLQGVKNIENASESLKSGKKPIFAQKRAKYNNHININNGRNTDIRSRQD